MAGTLSSWLRDLNVTSQEAIMLTIESTLWDQLSAEQRTRIIAILVRMLLHLLSRQAEVAHDLS
jgi:hypothetical protein